MGQHGAAGTRGAALRHAKKGLVQMRSEKD